jgi:hypothetical protein
VRLVNLFKNAAQELSTPHIRVRSSLASAMTVLESCADQLFPLEGNERGNRARSKSWELIIYAAADEVDSVCYDDESGRGFAQSKLSKIQRYLARYGPLADWELRLDNGWMRYWYNTRVGVMMVYGVHMDVIRFNKYEGE